MTKTDALYRALRACIKELEGERGAATLLKEIAKAPDPENVVVTHNICRVEKDWLDAIERGLVFVGKAIEEDRQFIRSEGEVQPIEKVRHISKESVQHLSKHSDLITREQKENDIVPDKLYTVERLSDYAVYENRFLYVLLCRIRDFVDVRYDAIIRAYKAYRGSYEVKKTVRVGATRRLAFEFRLTDEEDDAVAAPADRECAEALSRMERISRSVAFFLHTPLMTEVSKADKIKSKITKTNVLRMDKNFRESLALYEYLLAYDREGYEIEERVGKLDPVPEAAAREFAVPAALIAFLTYEHGLKLEDYLRGEYEKEEARRAEEAQKELVRAIKALKKRIEKTGEGIEQYMLLLEERNAALEKNEKLLAAAREKIAELEEAIERMRTEIEVLEREIEALNEAREQLIEEMKRAEEEHRRRIEELEREFAEKEEALRAAHAEEIARLEEERRAETEALRASHAEEVARLREERRAEIEALRERHAEELSRLKEEYGGALAREKAAHEAAVSRLREAYEKKLGEGENRLSETVRRADTSEAALSETTEKLAAVSAELEVVGARLTALRREYGLLGAADDFTTEEGFNALEHEFEVLGRLVREKWTDVKKILRKEFRDSLRATMRKKPQKSEAYADLSEKVKKRRAQTSAAPEAAPEEAPHTEETNLEEQAETNGEVKTGQDDNTGE